MNILNRNFAIADGIRYQYLTTVNNASSDTILLLAGFPQSSYAWRKVIPLLAEDYSVIAVDLPGQGDTDYPVDGYDTDSISLRLKKLLDSLEIKRFHLVESICSYFYLKVLRSINSFIIFETKKDRLRRHHEK